MAALRVSRFRQLLAGELISNFGDGIYLVALPWYVLAHHGGTLQLGAVLTAYGVPRTALLVAGGHASDRYRPWSVMLAANCTRGLAVAAFATTAAMGTAHGSVLILIAIVLGAGEGMFIPASQAIVSALLPRNELQAGNALVSGTTQLSQLAGPALGGVTVGLVGSATGFAIDAATFAVSAVTLIGVRREAPRPTSTVDSAGVSTITGSLRDLLGQPIVRLMLITDALVNLGSTGMGRVALPALARGPMRLGAGGYGALSAAMAAGMLLGTATASSVPPYAPPVPGVDARASAQRAADRGRSVRRRPGSGGNRADHWVLPDRHRQSAADHRAAAVGTTRTTRPPDGGAHAASVGMMPVSVLLAGLVIRLTGPSAYFPLASATVVIAATAQLSSPAWRRFEPGRL